MGSVMQAWGRGLYDGCSNFVEAGRNFAQAMTQGQPNEIDIRGLKAIFYAPALLACGAQVIGLLPLQSIVATMAVADSIFHHFSEHSPNLCKWAEKYELDLRICRFSVLVWTTGRLLPLSAASIMQANFFSIWLLSWPIAFIAAGAIKLVIQQINLSGVEVLDEQLKAGLDKENIKISWGPLRLGSWTSIQQTWKELNGKVKEIERGNHPSLWIVVSQQIVYVSLAIFSTSHLTYATLSAFNLYTLYKIAYTHWMSIDWRFKRLSTEGEVSFRWKATTLIGRKAKEEICSQLDSFFKAIETFEVVNLIQGRSIHSEKNLLQELQGEGQILNGQLSISVNGKKVELVSLNYYPGKEITVPLEGFNEKIQMLCGKLNDGTTVYFPNLHPEKARIIRQLEIKAQIISKFVRDNNLYLVCSSKDLPEEEKRSMTFLMEHGGLSIKIEGDDFSGRSDFEESFKDFCIVNQVTRIPRIIDGKEVGAEYKVNAEKDHRPSCDRLLAWVKDQLWGWCPAEIFWLNHTSKQSLRVKIKEFDTEKRVAYGSLPEPDLTTVYFPKAFSEYTEKLKGTTIEAQVVSSSVKNGFLYLECSSDALLPKRRKISINHTVYQQTLNRHIKLRYDAIFNPILDGVEKCPICLEAREVLYPVCGASHLFCNPCLTELLQKKMEEFRIVNPQPLILEGEIVTYKVCVQKEVLPTCAVCREVISSEDHLSVWIGDIPAEITPINYITGKTIHTKIESFDPFSFTATATLSNGTVIEFNNVQPRGAKRLIQSGDAVKAQILRKTVENGKLHLNCSSIDFPTRTIFTLDQELIFTIVGFNTAGMPFGFLPTGEKAYLQTKKVAIGDKVKGYFWEEIITAEEVGLSCAWWKKNQNVEIQLLPVEHGDPTTLVGNLTDGQIVLFYVKTKKERDTYKQGQVVQVCVRNFQWQTDGNFYLICSPKTYF